MFENSYLNLLILQYRDSPKASETIKANITKYEELYNVILQFEEAFDIDTAVGVQLDILGKIVGISRIIPDVIPKVYFGFDNNIVNSAGFGDAPFFRLGDSLLTDTQLNDYDYRFFIKAKIAKNVVTAKMIDDNLSIQDAIMFMFGNSSYITDNQDMTMSLFLDSSYPDRLLSYLLALDLIPRPQGVKLRDTIIIITSDSFGFNNNPNSKGFGIGKFARIKTI